MLKGNRKTLARRVRKLLPVDGFLSAVLLGEYWLSGSESGGTIGVLRRGASSVFEVVNEAGRLVGWLSETADMKGI